jgi:hypothetical protein
MNKKILSELRKYTNDNKYLKHYILLCDKAIHRATTKKEARKKIGYVETHHIIPTSFDKSISKLKSNMVHLSAREHFIAHKLLIYATTDNYKNKAKYTISKFIQNNKLQKRILSNRDYQFIREALQESMSGSNNPMYGENSPTLNKKCITDGTDNKFISSNELPPIGWYWGMSKPNIIITNGLEESRIYDISELPNGWWVGSKRKGKSTSLKGKKLGKYSDNRINIQKNAISNLKLKFYTNGVEDIKVASGESVPLGFWGGRTYGGHKVTDDMIKRSLQSFNVTSLDELEINLKIDIKNNINTVSKLKRKYVKNKLICEKNYPNILYFIYRFT